MVKLFVIVAFLSLLCANYLCSSQISYDISIVATQCGASLQTFFFKFTNNVYGSLCRSFIFAFISLNA